MLQDMYEGSVTAVRCAVGVTDGFTVEVGLHQGLGFEHFLVCNGDGQVDRPDDAGVCDVCG